MWWQMVCNVLKVINLESNLKASESLQAEVTHYESAVSQGMACTDKKQMEAGQPQPAPQTVAAR